MTRDTPLTCLKTASTPQKHPPAKTATCSPVAATSDPAAKSGTCPCAAVPARTPLAKTRANRRNNEQERLMKSLDIGWSRDPSIHVCDVSNRLYGFPFPFALPLPSFDARTGDPLEPLLDPPRLLLALLELLERVPEVRADLLKRHPAGVELLPQGTQVVLDLPGPLLELHPLQTVQDEQQVREERVGGNGDHFAGHRVSQDALPVLRILGTQDGFVVDVLGRDVHQREFVGPLARAD